MLYILYIICNKCILLSGISTLYLIYLTGQYYAPHTSCHLTFLINASKDVGNIVREKPAPVQHGGE